jgi:hypothetical protein
VEQVAMKRGLTPIAAGLIMAGVLALFQLSRRQAA